jgi:hypothetical protein
MPIQPYRGCAVTKLLKYVSEHAHTDIRLGRLFALITARRRPISMLEGRAYVRVVTFNNYTNLVTCPCHYQIVSKLLNLAIIAINTIITNLLL